MYDLLTFFLRNLFSLPNWSLWLVTDLALHDKILVYDLEKMRLGWTDYNCKLTIPLCLGISTINSRLEHCNSFPNA